MFRTSTKRTEFDGGPFPLEDEFCGSIVFSYYAGLDGFQDNTETKEAGLLLFKIIRIKGAGCSVWGNGSFTSLLDCTRRGTSKSSMCKGGYVYTLTK